MTIGTYESSLEPERESFARDPAVAALWDAGLETGQLELFLIHFSAMRASVAELVPGWLRRAGRRCSELGYDEVGRALTYGARFPAPQPPRDARTTDHSREPRTPRLRSIPPRVLEARRDGTVT